MNKSLISLATLILAMITLQYGSSLAKNLFTLSGVAGATGLRLFFAAICLILILKPWKIPFKRAYILPLLCYGISLGVMNLTFYFALSRIPLGIAVALEFTGPLLLAVIASKNKWDYLWVVFAALGIFFLLPGHDQEALDPWGIFFALLAGASWALYIIFGKRLSNTLPTKMGISYGMSVAALVVIPFAFAFNANQIMNTQVLIPGLLVGIFASAIPYTLELHAMKGLSQKSFSILMSLEPAIATIIGVIFLSEFLNLTQVAAIVFISIASLGTSLTNK